MDDVFSIHSLAPFAFEVERIVGGEQPGPRHNLGLRRAAHIVEDSRLGVDVVLGVIAVELGPVQKVFIADVAPGLYIAGIVVVIHRVGIQFLVDAFQVDVAARVAKIAIRFLCLGIQRILPGRERRPAGSSAAGLDSLR